ncbi:amidohydrolase [Virgibacillus sp. NKC19-3]|uniref:amidohydrolase n=1 Tax=Virgibacillus saliphilus TaxID=2831674 RepID=UPI001C9A42E8|nr:amidohydrolase [Virgibacillus sp. NKC19-3]MBY7144284.1 amidohydrolase [Virgibacillus sp. NKC19-3]
MFSKSYDLERIHSQQTTDLILKNGAIYTVDGTGSWAEALVIDKSGKLVYVGDDEGTKELADVNTTIIDLEGKMVLPGFVDSHTHVTLGSVTNLFSLNLTGITSLEECLQALREFRKENAKAQVIRGRGWDDTIFSSSIPIKKILDNVISDVPVILYSETQHSAWVNSKALEIAEITMDTPNPTGAVIERDAAGEPNGILREFGAFDLIESQLPSYTIEEYTAGIQYYQSMANAFGITTAHDPMLHSGGNDLEAIRKAEESGLLNMRILGSLLTEPDRGVEQVAELVKEKNNNNGALFMVNSAKIFMDGVVEANTAYLKEPYENMPDFYGELIWSPEEMDKICSALDKEGFQIHVHAIGDAALSNTLNSFAHMINTNGNRDARHQITHLQLVDSKDIKRFYELGVIGIPQPYWFIKFPYYSISLANLGQERAEREFPMKSFIDAGVVMASASDYPILHDVHPCNPLIGIQAGISRDKLDPNDPADILWREERVNLEDMISSFTINGAYANFIESITGSIEIGKMADLIILDKNLFEIPVKEINKVKVLMTFFQGKEIYRNNSFEPLIYK